MARGGIWRQVGEALSIATVVAAAEYGARRGLAPYAADRLRMPLAEADLLAIGVVYVPLGAIAAWWVCGSSLAALRVLRSAAGRWQGWVGGAVALCCVALSRLDAIVWRSHPWWPDTPPAGAGHGVGSWVAFAVGLLILNGVVVPIAEELLWRGLVQPRLLAGSTTAGGIVVTSVLFSLKHVLVDHSLARAVTITAIGGVLGYVAHKTSWACSAISHGLMNVVATTLAIVSMHVLPPCMSPQPTLSPELRDAVDRVASLIGSRSDAEIDAVLSERFVAHFGRPEVDRFFSQVHVNSGDCTWQCATNVESGARVSGRLSCSRMPARMEIGVDATPDHKVSYLVILSNPLF